MVSCITVSRNRHKLLQHSIFQFNQQTHADKELIVIYYSDDEDTVSMIQNIKQDNIHFYPYNIEKCWTLGDLRNYAIDKTSGDYICVWDDDDIYHPDRISMQLEKITGRYVACTIRREIRFNVFTNRLYLTKRRKHGLEGSLLCKKKFFPKYSKLNSGEDTPVLSFLGYDDKIAFLDRAHLYIYVYHGKNTVSSKHFNTSGDYYLQNHYKNKARELLNLFYVPENYMILETA